MSSCLLIDVGWALPTIFGNGRWAEPTLQAMPLRTPAHSRRDFLARLGGGFGTVALASMLQRDQLLAAAPAPVAKLPHFKPRATRVIQLFMSGAASQCDTFDYKPLLAQRNGQKWDPGEKVE